MDTEEDTSSTSSGPSTSEKSNSAKRAESESPEGVISPDQSTTKSKPDRSNGDEPPCKIQKQDPTCSVVTKDRETSSDSLKEEVPTSESPNTEDEVPMEVDSPQPSDPKSEVTDTSATSSSENLKAQDPTDRESTSDESGKMQGPAPMVEDEKLPRSPSPTQDVSCQSEASDVTLQTTESIIVDEDTTLHVSSSLTTEILITQEATEKHLKKQDAMDEDENLPKSLQPEISSKLETSPKSLGTQDATAIEDGKQSPFQSDTSSELRQSDENLKTQTPSSASPRNLETGELTTEDEKSTAASPCQPDISSEPGPSGENLKTLESGILSEPGPSGEHLKTEGSTLVGEGELSLSSFNLDQGVIGHQALDRETCADIQAELDPRITSNQILSTFYRLRDSYVRQRRKQADNTSARERSGRYDFELLEGLENKDEISIRGWLKHTLPREADYLNSLARLDDESSVPDPPSLEDDTTYSLTSGTIPEGDRPRWRSGIALGERILRIGSLVGKCTPNDDRSRPNRDYNFESQMVNDLMNLLNDLARKISNQPEDPLAPEDLPQPADDVDSGNVSPSSLSFRLLPSIQEDDTSLGAASLRSEEEPVLGAVAASFRSEEAFSNQSPRPRHDQVARVLSEVSLDSESSDSITYYPKEGDTSSYKLQSSILDCPSIQDESDSASLSMAENPKEDQVASELAEVHLDNDDLESACSLEVHLDETESPSDLADVNLENDVSESTAFPTSSETSSDQNCGYTAGRRKKDEDSDGWC